MNATDRESQMQQRRTGNSIGFAVIDLVIGERVYKASLMIASHRS